MKNYLNLVEKILTKGSMKDNRTGIRCLTISGAMIEHDMADGFPLLTTKKMSLKNVAVELEFFIKGLDDKRWLQEHGCTIWDEWGMKDNPNSIGRVYGVQWRDWHGYHEVNAEHPHDNNPIEVDQLMNVVKTLKSNPNDRRMVVSAWQPAELDQMALPPCHLLWHVTVINGTLNLNWYQRSCDTMLGIPYNIASYGLLLKLLAKEAGLKEGRLCGMLGDVHIYENHLGKAKEQLSREPRRLPTVIIPNFTNIFDWTADDVLVGEYNPHPPIKFEVAV